MTETIKQALNDKAWALAGTHPRCVDDVLRLHVCRRNVATSVTCADPARLDSGGFR